MLGLQYLFCRALSNWTLQRSPSDEALVDLCQTLFLDVQVQTERERVGPCRTFQNVYLLCHALHFTTTQNSTGKKKKNILCALMIVFYSSEKRIYLYVYRTKAWVCEMFKQQTKEYLQNVLEDLCDILKFLRHLSCMSVTAVVAQHLGKDSLVFLR